MQQAPNQAKKKHNLVKKLLFFAKNETQESPVSIDNLTQSVPSADYKNRVILHMYSTLEKNEKIAQTEQKLLKCKPGSKSYITSVKAQAKIVREKRLSADKFANLVNYSISSIALDQSATQEEYPMLHDIFECTLSDDENNPANLSATRENFEFANKIKELEELYYATQERLLVKTEYAMLQQKIKYIMKEHILDDPTVTSYLFATNNKVNISYVVKQDLENTFKLLEEEFISNKNKNLLTKKQSELMYTFIQTLKKGFSEMMTTIPKHLLNDIGKNITNLHYKKLNNRNKHTI